MHVAIAAPSALSARAARAVVEQGGNAVDAAIAGAVASMVSEPGVTAPGAGAFVTIWPHDGPPVVYDGYMAVPGIGGRNPEPAETMVEMEYGGGIRTLVGPSSIAVPGAFSAFGDAHARFGIAPWAGVVSPAAALARVGIPLGRTSAIYLRYSREPIFGLDPAGRAALAGDGPVEEGATVLVEGLADGLDRIARAGAEDLYRGELAETIGTDLWARGSHLSVADLAAYRTLIREPLEFRHGALDIATNPVPAVGGVALAALLAGSDGGDPRSLIASQARVFGWRRSGGDLSTNREADLRALLAEMGPDPLRSPSTAHISTASADGMACAITLSAGYGSGIIPTGTGMWMNNALGELELVGDGTHLVAGERLNSNMAPTVARHDDGTIIAIGSPGADRITTALAQTIDGLVRGMDPRTAVDAPRIHVDVSDEVVVAWEPGIQVDPGDYVARPFDGPHMYFGGVGLALVRSDGSVDAITDPRRNGVAVVV